MMTSTTSHIRGQFEGTVLSNELICDEHYRMMLEAPGFPEIRPGQFAQLACREWDESRYEQHEMEWGEKLTGDEMTGQRAFLRRPFSFSGQEGSCIELIYRTVGVGTRWLSDLQPGKTLGVIGPLGNGFLFPPPGAGGDTGRGRGGDSADDSPGVEAGFAGGGHLRRHARGFDAAEPFWGCEYFGRAFFVREGIWPKRHAGHFMHG